MPELDVDGATLFYETAGHISAPAVLILHSDLGDLRAADPLIETLASTRFVIRLVIDPAHPSLAAHAVDLLDHLGVPEATLVAHGGENDAAHALARQRGERFPAVMEL